MAQIQLDEKVFAAAQRHAADAGYASVEEYITEFVVHDGPVGPPAGTPNLDHLFTPELLAEIDKADAEIDAGHFFTSAEVDGQLRKQREEWLQKNSNL